MPRLLPLVALPLVADALLMISTRWLGRREGSEGEAADTAVG